MHRKVAYDRITLLYTLNKKFLGNTRGSRVWGAGWVETAVGQWQSQYLSHLNCYSIRLPSVSKVSKAKAAAGVRITYQEEVSGRKEPWDESHESRNSEPGVCEVDAWQGCGMGLWRLDYRDNQSEGNASPHAWGALIGFLVWRHNLDSVIPT